MSQRDLAEAVGISVGSAHYVLNALIEMGHIKLGNFNASEDKRRYAYILTPRGVAEKAKITKQFLARKLAEYEALKEEIEEIRGEIGAFSGCGLAEKNCTDKPSFRSPARAIAGPLKSSPHPQTQPR